MWNAREITAGLITLLALAGVLPHAYFEIHHAARLATPPYIDDRYAGVLAALPAGEKTIGYVSDLPLSEPDGKRLYAQAQYAAVPHVLLQSGRAKYVLVNASDEREAARLCASAGLRIIAGGRNGVVLTMAAHERVD